MVQVQQSGNEVGKGEAQYKGGEGGVKKGGGDRENTFHQSEVKIMSTL